MEELLDVQKKVEAILRQNDLHDNGITQMVGRRTKWWFGKAYLIMVLKTKLKN